MFVDNKRNTYDDTQQSNAHPYGDSKALFKLPNVPIVSSISWNYKIKKNMCKPSYIIFLLLWLNE